MPTITRNRDYKNLKSVARAYGSRLLSAVYRESSEEWVRLEANLHEIELPARDEVRRSIGIDRCLIPDARIGWTVNLYESNEPISSIGNLGAAKPLASGQVRKFVQREGRQDLAILRLKTTLDIKGLIDKQPSSTSTGFVVLYASVENPRILRRCLHTYFAIDQFMRLRCSESVAKLLIGDLYPNPVTWRYPPSELLLPRTIDFKLTREQNRALQIAIKKHISIIDGTVGSGKTHLAACIAYVLAVQKFQKVLICSQATGTIELLAKLLMTNGASYDDSLSVIRISDDDNNPLKFARRCYDLLNGDVKQEANQRYCEFGQMKRLMREQLAKSCKLNHLVGWDLYTRYLEKHRTRCNLHRERRDIERSTEKNVAMCCKASRKKSEYRLLDNAHIVCCTLDQVGRKLISRHKFDVLIIDDAHLPNDAEILIPLMYPNLKQIILLGQDDVKLNYNDSRGDSSDQAKQTLQYISRNLGQERYKLFSRLVNSYGPLARLTQQFRSHEKLIDFCNDQFYKSKLRTHPNATRCYVRNCVARGDYNWLPNLGNSMSVIFGNSTINHKRAQDNYLIIEKIINKLVELEKYPKSAITMVTNLDYMQNTRVYRVCLAGVEVRNISDVIGLENEFIILCCQQPTVKCHRMSYELEPDFTRNAQALHIALTRAKLGLFVVGDQSMLDCITQISANNDNFNESSMSLSSKSVVWIDQESSDYCAKWRAFVQYHRVSGSIAAADTLNDTSEEAETKQLKVIE